MTIINICFYDGTPESAKCVVDGLNRTSGVDRSIVVVPKDTRTEELVKIAGTGREFDYCVIENRKYEIVQKRLNVKMNEIRSGDDTTEFRIAVSTATGIEAFVCYPLMMMFGATVYTNDGDEVRMDSLVGINDLDSTKVRILRTIERKGIMNANELVNEGVGIKYRACKNALKKLERSKYIESVKLEAVDNGRITDWESGKRGPKSELYRLTEKGKLACGLVL